MKQILLVALGLFVVAASHAPRGMLKDFWNMLWKRDSGYEDDV